MALIEKFGEMWARTPEGIEAFWKNSEHAQGVYILYDGSTPVYIGKGNIGIRLRKAARSKSKRNFWDHFSWFVIKDRSLRHDVEALLLRTLPPYLRHLTKQSGKFTNVDSTDQEPAKQRADYISRSKVRKSSQ